MKLTKEIRIRRAIMVNNHELSSKMFDLQKGYTEKVNLIHDEIEKLSQYNEDNTSILMELEKESKEIQGLREPPTFGFRLNK